MADPICYLDMDGVIADFVGACLWNHDRDDLTPEDITEWDFHKTILGCKTEDDLWAFWAFKGYNFWADIIKPEPWANDLVRTLEERFGDRIVIVTSVAPDSPRCYEGKCDWIEDHFPQFKGKVVACSKKWLLAHPNAILIDDKEKTVDKFQQNGGKVILFPRTWNSGRTIDKYRRIDVVRNILSVE